MIALAPLNLIAPVYASELDTNIIEDSFQGMEDFPRELIRWETLSERSALGITVDVLFVYDNSTRAAYPNISALEAEHDEWIGVANTILEADGVPHRFNRVGTVHVNRDATNVRLDELVWAKESELIASIRDQYRGDLVTYHVSTVGPIGLAYGTLKEDRAFSLLGTGAPNWVAMHEWGHNMTGSHGVENQDPEEACLIGRCGLAWEDDDGVLWSSVMRGSYGPPGSIPSYRLSKRDLPGANPLYHNMVEVAEQNMPVMAEYRSGPDCASSPTNLCLAGERFKVEVTWTDFTGNSGVGQVVPGASGNSGLFWFFDQNNWEMMVKVLNGCGLNEHFWVFFAATTNVEYTLTVTDTQSNMVTTYFNPLGTAPPATTDTEAFACN